MPRHAPDGGREHKEVTMKQDIYDLTVAHILENQEKSYRLAYSYVRNQDSALDVVQNAVCRALEKCWELKNPEAIRTWYYRIVVNEALMYLRKNKRETVTEPAEMKEETYLEEGYERAGGNAEDVYAQVCQLPEDMKTVVLLRFYEELSLKEIADVTHTNLNTVKTRLYGALKKLKMSMEVLDYEKA